MSRRPRRLLPGPGTPLLALFIVLLLGLSLPSGVAAEGGEGGPPVVYLTERPFEDSADQWNFTTFPADANESGRERQAEQMAMPTFLADWRWRLPIAPANWSVTQNEQWDFVLFIEGFDDVLPLPGSLIPPSTSLASHEIKIDLFAAEDLVASGSINVSVLDTEPGVQKFTVPVAFSESQDFIEGETPPSFRIDILVSGRGLEPESPLLVHFGSTAHPSHVVAASYPMEGLRAMELEYLLEKECKDLIMQQKSCEQLQQQAKGRGGTENGAGNGDDENKGGAPGNGDGNGENVTVTGQDPDRQNAPAPGLLLLVVGLLFGVGFVRSRFQARPGMNESRGR